MPLDNIQWVPTYCSDCRGQRICNWPENAAVVPPERSRLTRAKRALQHRAEFANPRFVPAERSANHKQVCRKKANTSRALGAEKVEVVICTLSPQERVCDLAQRGGVVSWRTVWGRVLRDLCVLDALQLVSVLFAAFRGHRVFASVAI